MRKREHQSSKKHTWALAVLLTMLVALSVVLSLTVGGILTSAYTPEDLDIAQEKEARLRQELEEARAEEARLRPFLERFSNKELDELLDSAVADLWDIWDDQLRPYANGAVKDILAIRDSKRYFDDYDRYNAIVAVVNDWFDDVNLQADDFMTIADEMFYEYIEIFSDSGVDMSLAREALIWEMNNQRTVMYNAILTFFDAVKPDLDSVDEELEPVGGEPGAEEPEPDVTDPEPVIEDPKPVMTSPSDEESPTDKEPAPPEKKPEPAEKKSDPPAQNPEQVIYDAVKEVKSNLEYAVYDLPNWVEYCIIDTINFRRLYELNEEWEEVWLELSAIRKQIYGYDYSFKMSNKNYQIGSGTDITITINGDYEAIENELYFDIYDPVWSDEMGYYVLIGHVLKRGEDFTVSEKPGGGIILNISSGYLDNMAGGAQLFAMYYLLNIEKATDVYIEIIEANEGAVPVLEPEPELTAAADPVSDADEVARPVDSVPDPNKLSLKLPLTGSELFLACLILAEVVLAAAVFFIVRRVRKMKRT